MCDEKQIVLVSTGTFQDYIKENINQLLKFEFDIHVIVDFTFFKEMYKYKSSIKLIDSATLQTDFDKKSKLDKNFRGGFWNYASKRLFLVYEYIKMKNLTNVIHLENDVLLYSSLNYNFEEKIYITMDSNNRCIPGIIYIPKYDLFTNLIENYDFTKNDMINLSNFYNNNTDIVKTFPIIDDSLDISIYNENFQEFNSIFDAAAIGQYLGGVDPGNIAGNTTGFVNETCEIKYDKYKFKWVKKRDDFFPYIEIKDKLIAINNLHIHCKKLINFRMINPVVNKYIKKYMNTFITGEKIQFSCDHFVGTDEDFRFNPNVAQYKNRFIYLGNNANIDNKLLVFCYTHLLGNIEKLVRTLKGLQNPFKLVLHNSDGSFDRKHIILFEKLPLLQCIYAQNINVEDEKVFPLPIGLANSQWTHGNSKIHQTVYDMPIEKSKVIYFNFSKNTNKIKRVRCYNDIIKKGITWNNNIPYKEYLIELKRHKFAICPEGNGIDTHRFWECLYMNTIPICLKNKITEHYKKYFPLILLDDWKELDVSKLSYSAINHQYLDMEFIKICNLENMSTNQINNNLQTVEKSSFNTNLFDIVILVGPNDKSVIEQQIKYTQKNIIGYRNIYLICYDPSIIIDGCTTINENIFPFNIETVAKYHGKLDRNGWYLQQLFKLYSGKIIPNILDKYLVIDCDTFFLKPTTFVENNKCLYNYGTEYHKPYFHHMEKLDKGLIKVDKNKSGICHHMIFETKYIDELIAKIEKNHNDLFYNVFLKTVTDKKKSGASEFEIYFNYMLKYNTDEIQIRKLSWENVNKLETNSNYDYISYHWYMR
ncbi:DUF6492 family protein [Candidatus Pelagisphaera phototrophica]|uniref:DUF6492 family protein n=1 Tax=Candidatus Pelagisphaera phototrophica TaxID=2684113 RepID=UPI0019F6DF4E|nr:DUF6492 family protein [Candidatus Pelagisphaera phototrophica]QXD31053.1 hypothetical protein GA004_11955 [Candidatus Pelagisphaera phototrophica]